MKLLHSFCDPTDTMPTVTSFNGRFIDSEGKNYYDISAGKGCNVLGFNNEYIQYHIAHAHRVWPSNDWNAKPEIWTKLEDVLKHPPKNAKLNVKGYDATPAMPDECKIPGDVVGSYRKYYVMKKQRFATWKSPSVVPQWWTEALQNGI